MDLKSVVFDTRRLLTGAAVLFVAVATMTGVGQTFRETGYGLGIRRFVTPEIGPDWRVGELFRTNTGGLRAITVRPALVGTPEGRVRLEVRPLTPHGARVFRSAEVPAAEFARADTYRFEFAPIPDSRGVTYQLDILSSPDAPSRGESCLWNPGRRCDKLSAPYSFATSTVPWPASDIQMKSK